MEIFKRVDLGLIKFGMYNGKNWSDVPLDYLTYIIKDECRISQENKEIAKKEIQNRKDLDGQILMF